VRQSARTATFGTTLLATAQADYTSDKMLRRWTASVVTEVANTIMTMQQRAVRETKQPNSESIYSRTQASFLRPIESYKQGFGRSSALDPLSVRKYGSSPRTVHEDDEFDWDEFELVSDEPAQPRLQKDSTYSASAWATFPPINPARTSDLTSHKLNMGRDASPARRVSGLGGGRSPKQVFEEFGDFEAVTFSDDFDDPADAHGSCSLGSQQSVRHW
jgi:hypothetical protein